LNKIPLTVIFSISVLLLLGSLSLIDARHSDEGITLDLIPGFNQINYRDSTNTSPQTVTLSLDKLFYLPGKFVEITVEEEDSNLDSSSNDVVLASMTSTTTGLIETPVILTETGADIGIFRGQLFLSSTPQPGTVLVEPGGSITAFYLPEHDGVGRLSADLRGVNQAGTVNIFDFTIDNPDGLGTRANAACPYNLVTHPVDLQLSPGLTADNVTVTISYANAVLGPHDINAVEMLYRWSTIPALFTGFKELNGILDTASKTITATTPPIKSFIPGPTGLVETVSGQYALGVKVDNCVGGGGGGLVIPDLILFSTAKILGSTIGGVFIPIDTTSLLLAGTYSNASWLIPVIVAGIGIGFVILRKF